MKELFHVSIRMQQPLNHTNNIYRATGALPRRIIKMLGKGFSSIMCAQPFFQGVLQYLNVATLLAHCSLHSNRDTRTWIRACAKLSSHVTDEKWNSRPHSLLCILLLEHLNESEVRPVHLI